jgi:hypothetical protein
MLNTFASPASTVSSRPLYVPDRPHVSDRADFLASLATGPGSDPYFRFEPQDYEETDAGVVTVVGRQVYRWRESDEVASSTGQALRLEFADAIVSRATVESST